MADSNSSSSGATQPAGFKLKLKLGGTSSTLNTASAPSTGNATPSVPAASSSSAITTATPRLPVPSTSASSIHTLYDNKNSDAYMEDDGLQPEDDDDAHGADDFVPPADEVVEDNTDYLAGGAKKKASRSRKKGSTTPADLVDPTAIPPSYQSPFPPGLGISPSSSPAPPSKKKKASGGTSTPSSVAGSAAASGSGRGWRKGIKGKPEAGANDYMLPGASGAGPPAALKRKRPAYGEEGGDGEDDEEFMPAMIAPGGLATSEKWANGLPGGNEQSRATAAMAAAVNKVFPVGQPPRTGSGFLIAQPLDKNTPRPRSWAKAKREIIGPSGVPFYVSVWVGGGQSPYADHMLTHPRPPPIEKKPITASATHLETGSPHPERAASNAGSEAGDDADAPGAAKKPKARRKPAAPRKGKAAAAPPAPVQQVAPVVLAPPPQAAFPYPQ